LRWLPSLAALAMATVPALWAGAAPARAAELVMVEAKGCPWCVKWHRDLGAIYPKTAEGKRLPLRVVRLENLPADLRFIKNLRYAPTFVAIACGREVGRITGYNGDDMFWGELSTITKRLTPAC
jgi:hypothetical protein